MKSRYELLPFLEKETFILDSVYLVFSEVTTSSYLLKLDISTQYTLIIQEYLQYSHVSGSLLALGIQYVVRI